MGTTLDPSIITGQLQQQAENTGPQQTQGWLGARQLLLQNQQLAAKQAAGQDFQKSINPLTGQVDYGKFNALLGGDPRAAFAAQDSSQAGLVNQNTQQANLQSEVQTYRARQQALAGLLDSWKNKPNLSRGDVIDGVTSLDSELGIPASATANIVASFDPNDPQGWLSHETAQHQALAAAVDQLFPQSAILNNGASQIAFNRDPISGAITPVATIQNTMSPGDANQMVTLTGPNGQVFQMTRAQFATFSNGNSTAAPPPAGSGSTSSFAPMPGTGRPPTPSAPGAQPASPPVMPGIAEPAPLQSTQIGADTDYAKGIINASTAAPGALAALTNIRAALPGATTGPISDDVTTIASALSEMGVKGLGNDVATQTQNLAKSSVQLLMQAGQNMGVPTDQKLMTAGMGVPNSHLTQDANATIAAEISGMWSYQLAAAKRLQQAESQGVQAGSPQFAALRQELNNPMLTTAAQFMYMSPQARGRVLAALGPKTINGKPNPQWQALSDGLNWMKDYGSNLPNP